MNKLGEHDEYNDIHFDWNELTQKLVIVLNKHKQEETKQLLKNAIEEDAQRLLKEKEEAEKYKRYVASLEVPEDKRPYIPEELPVLN